ncbi:hypothetical protein BDF14DRAFT_1127887 [Spinellus fusiger]|nr:hypothetical protein BDF14DRAFT_1127887 [Spinellus fusiger]
MLIHPFLSLCLTKIAHAFRQVILKFIIYQLENTTHILPALQFISHQAPYLFPTPLETLKQRIFALCFMLQTTGGYWDLQIRFWMYKALEDLQMPSSRWLQQIQSSPAIQDAETLKQSRTIVEACQRSPSHHVYWAQQWMEILPPAIVSGSVSIQLNLFIYHTLCPYEITGLLHTLHSSRSVSMSAVKVNRALVLNYPPDECIYICSVNSYLMTRLDY